MFDFNFQPTDYRTSQSGAEWRVEPTHKLSPPLYPRWYITRDGERMRGVVTLADENDPKATGSRTFETYREAANAMHRAAGLDLPNYRA